MEISNEFKESKKPYALIFLGIFLLWIGVGFAPHLLSSDAEGRGAIGDMFGAVNALFSGMAFAGVIVAIMLQRQELMLQRIELEQTRLELKKSAEAQAEVSRLAQLNVEMQVRLYFVNELNEASDKLSKHLTTGPSDAQVLSQIQINEGKIAQHERRMREILEVFDRPNQSAVLEESKNRVLG